MRKNHIQIGLAGMMLTATVLGTPARAAQFTDVASNHWASASISNMVDKGVLEGVGNNKFDPTKEVTYNENHLERGGFHYISFSKNAIWQE